MRAKRRVTVHEQRKRIGQPSPQTAGVDRRNSAFLAILAVVVVAVMLPSAVLAQAGSLSQPDLGSAAAMQSLRESGRSDRGLRSGEFILTPSMELDVHHDTNVFNGNEREVGNEPVSGTSLRLIPRLGLTNGSDSDIQFAFDAAGDARIYIADSNSALGELTNFGGNADLAVTFFRRRAISLTLSDNFARSLQANNWETTETLNRLGNAIGARVAFHPGEIPERRPLEIALSGGYVTDSFDEFRSGNTTTIRSRLSGSWRFLPMTALLLDARWDFRDYEAPSALGLTANSTPWRVKAGLSGAITQTISFRAAGGYGMSQHDTTNEAATFSGFLASVGLLYRPSTLTLISIGYDRDFQDSFYGNFYSYHRGLVSLRQGFGSLVSATVWFNFSYATFGRFDRQLDGIIITQRDRRDSQLRGGLRVNIEASRLLALNLGYQVRGVITNYQLLANDASQRILDVGAYMAHEIFAGVVVRY